MRQTLFFAALSASLLSVSASPVALPATATVSAAEPSDTFYPPAETGVPNPAVNQTLIDQLELAATQVDRVNILKGLGTRYFKYDFNLAANPDGGVSSGKGGQGDLANRKTFPALIGLGLAMSAGFLNPCGMNTPHIHPRATEFLTIVQGGNVRTGFLQENGAAYQISETLDQFQGSILPQGSIHFEFNDNCEPAVFMAAFSHEDPGLSSIAQSFFSLDPGILEADLGYPRFLDHTNIQQFEKSIPVSFANGMKECFTRCGIKYT